MRGAVATVVAIAAGALAPAAAAHSIVLPFSSRPADLQLYTVVVPTETDAPTREVAVKIPEGIDFLLVKETPGWKVEIERRADRIDVVRWKGTAGVSQFAEFRLIARNPILEGDIAWKITQTYGNGETVRWIGEKGSEFPASFTRLSESAEPVDVATGLNGAADAPSGAETTDGEAAPEAAAATTDEEASDGLARAAAAAALLLALVALGIVLAGRLRRRESS